MELGTFSYDPPKAKRYISYDEYVEKTQNLSLEGEVYELGKFKSKNPFVVIAPCSNGKLSWDYRLVGHLVRKASYPLISEVGKTAALSLIRDVEDNLAGGKCFSRFNSSNLVLTPTGQVLLKNVTIIKPSKEARKNNIEDTYTAVMNFFDKKHLPPDVGHLLQMMDAQINASLYSIHASLVPHTNKGWGYFQMYEFFKQKVRGAEKRKILPKIPYHDNWRALVRCNSVLVETYGFILGRYDPRTRSKSSVDRQIDSAELFLDFIRNGMSHRSQRKLITVGCQFDLIVLVLFPRLLNCSLISFVMA